MAEFGVLTAEAVKSAAEAQGLGIPTDPKKTLKLRGTFPDLGDLAVTVPELRKLDISEVALERLPIETIPQQLTFLKAMNCSLQNIALSVSDIGGLEELKVANLGNNNISSEQK
jgi:Leucine-rich repeat (LRR) protein